MDIPRPSHHRRFPVTLVELFIVGVVTLALAAGVGLMYVAFHFVAKLW